MLVDENTRASKVPNVSKKAERWNDPAAHVKLRELYQARIQPTGMSQSEFGAVHGIGTQGMVWQYLSGHKPLSLEAAAKFARALGCTIYDISPSLAEALKSEILPVLGPKGWRRAAVVAILSIPGFFVRPDKADAAVSISDARTVHYVKLLIKRCQVLASSAFVLIINTFAPVSRSFVTFFTL